MLDPGGIVALVSTAVTSPHRELGEHGRDVDGGESEHRRPTIAVDPRHLAVGGVGQSRQVVARCPAALRPRARAP